MVYPLPCTHKNRKEVAAPKVENVLKQRQEEKLFVEAKKKRQGRAEFNSNKIGWGRERGRGEAVQSK